MSSSSESITQGYSKRLRRDGGSTLRNTKRTIRYTRNRSSVPAPGFISSVIRYDKITMHPLLRFQEQTGEHNELQKIADLPPFQHYKVDETLLCRLGSEKDYQHLVGPKWMMVLDPIWPQYHELTLEFLSTIKTRTDGFYEEDAVSFSLGGKIREMSIPQFAVATTFYSSAEAHSSSFKHLSRCLATRKGHVRPTLDELKSFWEEIAEGDFSDDNREISIKEPLIRYLHRALAGTLFGTENGRDKVSISELVAIHSILKGGGGNIASFLISSAESGPLEGAHLTLGPYISLIAMRLGVFGQWPSQHLTAGPVARHFPLAELQQARIISSKLPEQWSSHRGTARRIPRLVVRTPNSRPRAAAAIPPPHDIPSLCEELLARQDLFFKRQENITRYWLERQHIPIPNWYQASGNEDMQSVTVSEIPG